MDQVIVNTLIALLERVVREGVEDREWLEQQLEAVKELRSGRE